jgi:phosphoribosylanthranilate isomerase
MNSILTESTQFEVVDESLGNAALKKFEVDENSMLSRGIKPENIRRIYEVLFVYSIGFNNSVKMLVENNTEVMKNVWRVFSILL